MSTNIVFNGTTYSIPAEGDTYGDTLSSYLIAIASATLQKSGGSFSLTNELNFGASYGIKLAYLKSQSANPASAGVIRLGNSDSISFRNAANSSNLSLSLSTDSIQFNSINLVDVSSAQTLTNKTLTSPVINSPTGITKSDVGLSNVDNTSDVTKNSAAVTLTNKTISGLSNTLSDLAYGSLVLTNTIVNADISSSAAIAYSKLNLASSIVNADISASAGIEFSKLETLTSEKMVVTDPSGKLTTIGVSAIKAGYLTDVTSNIQAQINDKAAAIDLTTHESDTSTHGVSGNIVGTSDSQILTNKDIDGGTASNSLRITIPKNTLTNLQGLTRKQGTLVFDTTSNKPYYDDGSNLKVIGSGAGGAINFITDGDAEAAQILTGYTSSSVGTRPAGTQSAGASNLTLSQTTSSPLSGNQSFLITKAAANAQGQNASIPFTVDLAYRAKAVTISFDYLVNSGIFQPGSNFGTIQDSDVIAYIYDVTNSTYIEPSNFRLLSNSTSIADKFQATFQTSSTGQSYRLILHVATTSASAWAVKCENFSVGPSASSIGAGPLEEILAYQTGTNSSNAGTDTLVNLNTVVGSLYTYSLSSNAVTVKSSGKYKIRAKLEIGANTETVTLKIGINGVKTSGRSHVVDSNASGSNNHFEDSFYVDLVVGDVINMYVLIANSRTYRAAELEITQQRGSDLQLSNETETRVVDFVGYPSANQALTANVTNVNLATLKDSHGAWTGSTYVIPVAGDYEIKGTAIQSATDSSYQVYVNAVQVRNIGTVRTAGHTGVAGSLPNLRAGDIISFRADTTSTILGAATAGAWSISRISGPSTIAASETVAASYCLSANQAVTANTTTITFDTKDFDSHGTSLVSGVFTPQISGTYNFSGFYAANGASNLVLYKISTAYKIVGGVTASGGGSFSTDVRLLAGETVHFRSTTSVTVTGGALTAGSNLNIKRIGN